MKKYAILFLEMVLVFSLCGCFGAKKYNVDYGGNRNVFLNAADSYRAGEKVTLKVMLATDTDYTLSVEGKEIIPEVRKNGSELWYVFKMPDHDIQVQFSSRNSMVNPNPAVQTGDTEGTLLFDFYKASVAVVGDAAYSETTINEADGKYCLNTYAGSRTDGTTTKHTAYNASAEVLERVMQVVKKYEMEKWNDSPGVGMCGAITVVKFRDAAGQLIRVSSDHMPDGGEQAFAEIRDILGEYLTEDNRIE